MKLLGWEEEFRLLPYEEELDNLCVPEEMKVFLRNAFWDQNPERLAKAAFEANWRAKEEDCGWYAAKDFLLSHFTRLSPQYLIWGMGQDNWGGDVLYIDLPGSGQISFHVFWENVEGLPAYPFLWTGICNEKDLLESPRKIWVLGSDEELILDGDPGEKHNVLVRAGENPALAWE